MGAGTMTGGGAALLRTPARRERATATGLGTAESMTATEAAGLALCAAVTTARSSELTTTRRTTAARDRMDPTPARMTPPQAGGPGQAGDVWLQGLSGGSRSAGAVGVLSTTGGWAASTPRRDTPTLTAFSFSSLNCHVKFELFREINNLRR